MPFSFWFESLFSKIFKSRAFLVFFSATWKISERHQKTLLLYGDFILSLTCGTSHLRFFFLHQIFALEMCRTVGPVLGRQAAPQLQCQVDFIELSCPGAHGLAYSFLALGTWSFLSDLNMLASSVLSFGLGAGVWCGLDDERWGGIVVRSPSCVQLFVTPWTAACQPPLSCSLPHTDRFRNLESEWVLWLFSVFVSSNFKLFVLYWGIAD